MALNVGREKLNKAFFVLVVVIIAAIAVIYADKKYGLYFHKTAFSISFDRVIGTGKNLKGPAGVAFGKNNNLYVVDSGNSRILKFNINGRYLGQWGIEGKAAGEFIVPLYAAAYGSPEKVYVVDSGNSRIQVFDHEGRFISEFGKTSHASRTLTEPTFIGFAYNKYYVANSGSADILIFNKNGQFYENENNLPAPAQSQASSAAGPSSSSQSGSSAQQPAGSAGTGGSASGGNTGNTAGNAGGSGNSSSGNGQGISQAQTAGQQAAPAAASGILKKPVGMAFSKKYIYVSDYDLSKILVFNRQFDYIGSIGHPGQKGHQLYHPVGIAYKNGYLYVANYGRSMITVFKLDGGYNVIASYNFGMPGKGRKNFNHESNISISSNGEYLAIADTNNNRVLLYRITGS